MKNKGVFIIAIFVALVLKVMISFGQDSIRLSVHFDYGKSILLPQEIVKLDSLFLSLQNHEASSMRITGNTDAHGSHEYNLALSDARARAVYDYFSQKGLIVGNLEILGQGKTLPMFPGEDESSRAGNRRTDIEIVLEPKEESWSSQIKKDSLSALTDNSPLDLTFPNGIRLIIPSGAYSPFPNGSLSFAPVCNIDMDKLVKSGFTTMANTGEVLASAGIFCSNSSLKNGENLPDTFKLNVPMEVWIPVNNCACMPGNVALWDSVTDENDNIVWVKNKEEIRLERIGLKKYYVFNVRSLASVNLDCIQSTKTIKLAIRRYEPQSIKMVYPRAKAIIVGTKDAKGKISIPMLNIKEIPKVYAVAVDNDNNIYHINGKRFSNFKQNLLTGNYIIKKQDFRRNNALKIKKVNKEEVIFGYVEQ